MNSEPIIGADPQAASAPDFTENEVPLQAQVPPSIIREGNSLVLLNGALPDPARCVLTGKAAKHQKNIRLRNPMNPMTWIFGYEKIELGFTKKKYEEYNLKRALSWSLIGVGILAFIVGLMSSLVAVIFGAAMTVVGLIIRSIFPVWCSSKTSNSLTIKGCGSDYLNGYDARAT